MDVSDGLNFLQKALPWIGAAATGNVPALIGLAANAVGGVLGKNVDPTAQAITTAVANASPEEIFKLKAADDELKVKLQALGFAHEEELLKLNIQEEQVFVADTSDARHIHGSDRGVFWLGVLVLLVFALIMSFALYGAYQILVGGITIKDVAAVAAISGFVGTIIGYVASNAQQVIGYFFGSTKDSTSRTNAMTSAFSSMAGSIKGP